MLCVKLLCVCVCLGGGRLRLSDASSSTGLGPPLNENLSVASAGITTGCKVVLEPGRSPSNTEV